MADLKEMKDPSARALSTTNQHAMTNTSLELSPVLSSVASSGNHSYLHTPSSSVPNTPHLGSRAPSPTSSDPYKSDSNTFLTAIAAQERRVLEIREELYKAETELGKLKRQWAAYESEKKIDRLFATEPTKVSRGKDSGASATASARLEQYERRRADTFTRPTQRKVFSGSRHARTLSLLHGRETPNLSSRSHVRGESIQISRDTEAQRPTHVMTSEENISADLKKPSETDAILETGKQLVGDFRSGLWTFFEDLRQVTIGEDASRGVISDSPHPSPCGVSPSNPRDLQGKQSSRPSRPKTRANIETVDAHATNFAPRHADGESSLDRGIVQRLDACPPQMDETVNNKTEVTEDRDCDVKAEVDHQRDNTASEASGSPKSDGDTPRTSISSVDSAIKTGHASQNNSDRTWVTLSSLTPRHLTKTASHLMAEWERSLRPQEDVSASNESLAS